MPKRGHTSGTKLNLKDGFIRKPAKLFVEPDCKSFAEKCTVENKSIFREALGDFPKPIRTFGPKQFQALRQYGNSAAAYGMAAVLATLYLCEYKTILQYLPFYNGKYKKRD